MRGQHDASQLDAAQSGRAAGVGGATLLDELMTAPQMAAVLHMRVSTVEDYARRGLLPSVKLGRHRRFVRSDVEREILALAEPATRPRSLPALRSRDSRDYVR